MKNLKSFRGYLLTGLTIGLCACSTNNVNALMSGELDLYTHATMGGIEKKVDRKIAAGDFQGARVYLNEASYSDVVRKRLSTKIDNQEILYKRRLANPQAHAQAQAQAQRNAEKKAKKKNGWLGKGIALASGAAALGFAADAGAPTSVIGKVGGAMAADILTDGSAGALQSVTSEYETATSAANQATSNNPNGASVSLRPNMLASMGARCNSDPQVSSMCQAANAYYDNYVRVANKGELDPSQLYEIHRVQALQAMEFYQNNQVETGVDLSQPLPAKPTAAPKADSWSPPARSKCDADEHSACVTRE